MEKYVIMQDDAEKQEWDSDLKHTYDLNLDKCHWGQLKLFYTEFEFLTLCSKYFDISNCICVSVGAAPGTHLPSLIKYFPQLKFILYDPAEFEVEHENVEIHTGDDGFFTDLTIEKLKKNPLLIGKKILFISDIRLRTTNSVTNSKEFEEGVFLDMQRQQKWGVLVESDAIMIKFRLPYFFKNTGAKDFEYDYSDFKHLMNIEKTDNTDNKMLYLSGDIYWQIYGPRFTTETRLISRKNKDGKYDFKYYDYKDYESKCFYHNLYNRYITNVTYKNSLEMLDNIVGTRHNIENVVEYYLIDKYLKYNLKNHTTDDIIKIMYDIRYLMYKLTGTSEVICPIKTLNTYVLKVMKSEGSKDICKIKEKITKEYEATVERTIVQKKKFEEKLNDKNAILSTTDYRLQINIINAGLKSIEILYKGIMQKLGSLKDCPEK